MADSRPLPDATIARRRGESEPESSTSVSTADGGEQPADISSWSATSSTEFPGVEEPSDHQDRFSIYSGTTVTTVATIIPNNDDNDTSTNEVEAQSYNIQGPRGFETSLPTSDDDGMRRSADGHGRSCGSMSDSYVSRVALIGIPNNASVNADYPTNALDSEQQPLIQRTPELKLYQLKSAYLTLFALAVPASLYWLFQSQPCRDQEILCHSVSLSGLAVAMLFLIIFSAYNEYKARKRAATFPLRHGRPN